jgi:hypothetical protein
MKYHGLAVKYHGQSVIFNGRKEENKNVDKENGNRLQRIVSIEIVLYRVFPSTYFLD